MTWGQFKRAVESQGVTDDSPLFDIEIDGEESDLMVHVEGVTLAGGAHRVSVNRGPGTIP